MNCKDKLKQNKLNLIGMASKRKKKQINRYIFELNDLSFLIT